MAEKMAIAENLGLSLANLKLRETTARNQAIRDPLTGLYNRRYLEETMDRELHRSKRLSRRRGGDDGPGSFKRLQR